MTPAPENCLPRVCLIGAGPGHPGLITVAGLQALREAEVVIYDALVAPSLLAEAAPDALLIDAGKRARQHTLTQDQTNALLLEHARAGRRVARLKGGDPYLFGRGAEEVMYLSQHGIACEVIPGVTAGIAAPALAGIPVTHRQVASSVTFVTGHEEPGKPASSVDYPALAKLVTAGGTVCFYMGVGRLGAIATTLTQAGLDPVTPLAVIQWGTTSRQRTVRSTLSQAEADVAAAGLGAPAIIVVGAVAGLADAGLAAFSQRPLFGQRILITRSRTQASALRALLERLGATVLEAPTVQMVPPADWDAVDRAIRQLPEATDWVLLTSVNAVAVLAERLAALGLDSRHLRGVKLGAVGQATATALWDQLRLRPDCTPAQFRGAALVQALTQTGELAGQRVLLLRADLAGQNLPADLAQAGAIVTQVVAYHTQPVSQLPAEVVAALDARAIDWVTFTSASTARNLVTLLGDQQSLLAAVKTASIGPVTSDAMREVGLTVTVEAPQSDVPTLIQTICQAVAPTPQTHDDPFQNPLSKAPTSSAEVSSPQGKASRGTASSPPPWGRQVGG